MEISDRNDFGAPARARAVSFNRRSLLVGGAALALAGCRSSSGGGGGNPVAPATSAPGPSTAPSATQPASFSTLGPGSLWNGTAGSGFGGTPPQDPTRTTAKPVLHWWQPSQIRGVGPTLIGVIADAKGGISHVDFFVEGNVQSNVTATSYTDQNVNGKSRTRLFWGINVDCATAYAAHPTGAVRVYAKAYANDGTMQPRVIGPLTIYPRGVAYDWDVTVNPSGANTGNSGASGGNYPTLAAAMQGMKDALKLHGFECGRVTITQSGTYEWGSPDNWGFPWSYGLSCVTTVPGVTATIIRGAAFDPNNTGGSNVLPNAAWRMYSYVNNLEFRGSGVVIDRKNFYQIMSDNAAYSSVLNLSPASGAQLTGSSFFFNGCKITNSAGAWPHTYWNGVMAPAMTIGESNSGQALVFADSVTVEYVTQGAIMFDSGTNLAAGSGAIFSNVNQALGAAHFGASFVFGEYYANAPLSRETYYNNTSHVSATIQYVGSATGASINFSGNALTFTTTGGAAPYSKAFTLVDPQRSMSDGSSTFNTWAQIKSWMDANHPGDWSFSFPADPFSPYWIGNGANSWPMNPKSGTVQVNASSGSHSEWFMWYTGPYENVLVWDCTARNSGFSTSSLNLSTLGSNFRDVSIKNVTFDRGNSAHNTGNGTNPTGKHVCIENCSLYESMIVRNGVSELDSYSSVVGVTSLSMVSLSGSYGGTGNVTPTNCITANAPPSGNGNVNLGSGAQMSDATWLSLFNNPTAGDFTPAAGRALAANLFATVNPRDTQMTARAGSDAAGAWRIGGSAPTWPF